jgi:soluble lytic murein transglycosylase-like protein
MTRALSFTMLGVFMSFSAFAAPLQSLVKTLEADYAIPAGLLDSLVSYESGYNPNSTNPRKGKNRVASYGLGQLTLNTARRFCGIHTVKALYNPQLNLRCSAKLLHNLLARYRNSSVSWAIAAYNAGTPCICDGRRYRRGRRSCRASKRHCHKGEFLNQKYVSDV